ncbi:hypothetical protein [Paenibacillus sp. Soil787]|uniref:hypothetical protein n=1 Tax=Paenibacillus sp. Soil787 TaxID=1736411 RepID=UPI000702B5AB|nr:hypothetical protein [Paenibacillus sp. Soil787]KRF27643.1 hypothetical protein ASG93_29305 [Paenibacillus sp. Soil787]
MARFDFFASPKDNTELIKVILGQTELKLIPVDNYKSQKDLIFVREVDSIVECTLERIGMFHLWEESFYPVFPLDYHILNTKNEFNGLLSFHAAPSLVFSTSHYVINKDGDGLRGVSGYLSHTKELYDKANHAVIPIPHSVKGEHKRVVKIMKSKMKKLKDKNIWFGEEAYEMFVKGELEIYYGHLGRWITYKDVI